MACAYACMLLVMTYDSLLASSVLLGLVVGYFVTLVLREARRKDEKREKDGAGAGTEDVSFESDGKQLHGDDCCELGYLGGEENKST